MRTAVAEIPHGGRVIFISRSEPPPQFAELRAKQAMDLVEWSELRFTRAEVSGLLKRVAPGKWPKNIIDQLHENSDGWAAGLVLLSEQLRTQGESSLDR